MHLSFLSSASIMIRILTDLNDVLTDICKQSPLKHILWREDICTLAARVYKEFSNTTSHKVGTFQAVPLLTGGGNTKHNHL